MLKDNSRKLILFRSLELLIAGVTPVIISGLVLVFFMIIGFCTGPLGTYSKSNFPVLVFSLIIMGAGVFVGVVCFLCALPEVAPIEKWLKEVPRGTIVFNQQTKKIEEVLDEDIGLFKTHPVFGSGYRLLSISDIENISFTVHAVTSNPKVRHVTCSLELEIRGRDIETLQAVFDFLGTNEMFKLGRPGRYDYDVYRENEIVWETSVMSLLYDFCNFHSRELSELFNPLKKEQRIRFEEMVHLFFDPLLSQSGIQVRNCWFSIG